MPSVPKKIEISSKTIIFTVFFLLLVIFIWQIRDLFFSLFVAFIISSSLKPVVDFLERKKTSRLLASIFVYFLFLFIIYFIFALVFPPLVKETFFLVKNLPAIVRSVFPSYQTGVNSDFLSQNLPGLTNQTINLIKRAFSNVIFFISTIFFGFYFLYEKRLIEILFNNFFDEQEIKEIKIIYDRSQKKIADWFSGELILMITTGVISYIGFTLLGLKYSLALAVLAGLFKFIPNIGPIIAAVPAILIGLTYSSLLGLSVAVMVSVVQILEDYLLAPLVMKKVIGLHPVVTMIVLIIGGKLAGLLGVVIAVPMTLFLEVILTERQRLKKG